MVLLRRWVLAVLALYLRTGTVVGLRLVRLEMPSVVRRGDSVWMNCSYDLESDSLYSIKWYKNNLEFYRFLPSDQPPGQSYYISGVNVNSNRTNGSRVLLMDANLNTAGTYRCEVSADAPSFQTVRTEKELKVYVLPKKGPEIRGSKPYYSIGDVVNITCSAGPSKPPTELTWYINGAEAHRSSDISYPVMEDRDGLFYSSLGMSFIVETAHFEYGIMKLRCTATISQAYALSSEQIVKWPAANVNGADDGPIIVGGQTHYHVGDQVNVTCIYSRYGRQVKLQWYLNEKEVSKSYLIKYANHKELGRDVTSLGLTFRVRPEHFQENEMKLKCTATLSKQVDISSSNNDITVLGSSQQSSGLHIPEHYGAVASPSNSTGKRRTSVLAIIVFMLHIIRLMTC